VSPASYLIALPIGIIAVSGWMVKVESDNFLNTKKYGGIGAHPQHQAVHGLQVDPNPAARLDHARYGIPGMTVIENSLGETVTSRPIGSRSSRQSWLAAQSGYTTPGSIELPDIPGYIPPKDDAATHFQTVPAESGFHITAEEVTKLDMKSNTVVFNGGVKLTSPEFQLSSTRLKLHLSADKKSFNLAEADGDVHVQLTGVTDDKKYRGQSTQAIYQPQSDKLTLTGWPRIQGQGQELIAAEEDTKVFLNPKTGTMHTEGRAQTRVAKRFMDDESRNP